jgi:3-deoxy-D-manno-octulosonate 8-phosphate phosphatase KdsC-like HAD superfamily phosphatase
VYHERIANDGMKAYREERRIYRDERLRKVGDLDAVLREPSNRIVCFTVIERRGLERSRLVVFGDDVNDAGMIAMANLRIAAAGVSDKHA